ncbi:protein kinase domain-containing protein [Nocardioides sp. GXZ039]|uniref:protein kinase domain-containing protein n=1 Tax=Nocardioides sp. GXZ039 TaxID=3136018 RepID=UPI0030F48C29
MLDDVAPLEPGDPKTIGPYHLQGRLGVGGMGIVYLAMKADSIMPVAVKVIHHGWANDPEFRARFASEADAARRVPRFCTAAVLDASLDGPSPYLVTEYVEGPTLGDTVDRRGRLKADELDRVAVGIAAALTAIHDAGVVHRDLKPSNVLLSAVGPRVIDFGVARAANATTLTKTGELVGTPAYMAPEQINGEATDAAADVFAWGGLIAYAASGEPPFGPLTDTVTTARRILYEAPDLAPLPPGLRRIVELAMAKDPARRPSSRSLLTMVRENAERTATGGSAAAVLAQATVIPSERSPWSRRTEQPGAPWAAPTFAAPPVQNSPQAPTSPPGVDAGAALRAPRLAASAAPAEPRSRRRLALPLVAALVLLLGLGLGVVLDPFDWRGKPASAAPGDPETSTDPEPDESAGEDPEPDQGEEAPPEEFTIGDYAGQPASDVAAELEGHGIDVVEVQQASVAAQKGTVLSVSPSAGSVVTSGQTVTLRVGDGKTSEDRIVYQRLGAGDYLNSGAIVVVQPDGKHLTVGKGNSPDVTADGRLIAYAATDGDYRGQVMTVDANGKNLRTISKVTVGSVNFLAISPDGSRVVYSNNTGGIHILPTDGSGAAKTISSVDAFELDWSPDGRQIVFRRWDTPEQELWVIRADGTGLRGLIGTPPGASTAPFSPAWSPDGKQIAYSDGTSIYTVPAAGGRARAVKYGRYPSWTPEGDLVVVATDGSIDYGADSLRRPATLSPGGPIRFARVS